MKAFNAVTAANAKQVHQGANAATWSSFQDKPEFKKNVGSNRPNFPRLGRHQKDTLYQELLQPTPSTTAAHHTTVVQNDPSQAEVTPSTASASASSSSSTTTKTKAVYSSESDDSDDEPLAVTGTKMTGTIAKVGDNQSFCFIDGGGATWVFAHGSRCTANWPLEQGDTVEYYREKNDHSKNKWRASKFTLLKKGTKAIAAAVATKKQKTAHARNHFDAVQVLAARHATKSAPPPPQQVVATWMSALDGNGKIYYYHTMTRESTYTHPGVGMNVVSSSGANSGGSGGGGGGGATWVTVDAQDSKLKKRLAKLKRKREMAGR